MTLLQDQSHGRKDGQLRVSKQGQNEGVPKEHAADLSWAPPVPWTAGQEDDGVNRSGLDAVDYWQQVPLSCRVALTCLIRRTLPQDRMS